MSSSSVVSRQNLDLVDWALLIIPRWSDPVVLSIQSVSVIISGVGPLYLRLLLPSFPHFSHRGNWGLNFNFDLLWGNRNQFGSESLVIYSSINRFTPRTAPAGREQPDTECPLTFHKYVGNDLSSYLIRPPTTSRQPPYFIEGRPDCHGAVSGKLGGTVRFQIENAMRKYFGCLRLNCKSTERIKNYCECEEWWNDDVKDKNA